MAFESPPEPESDWTTWIVRLWLPVLAYLVGMGIAAIRNRRNHPRNH